MSNGPWTDEENDLIVADYFAMLAEDMAGRPYNKAQHRRSLMPLLRSRTEGSIEFKHQNISAVLKGLSDSEELHLIPMTIQVTVKPPKNGYGESNAIRYMTPEQGTAAPQAVKKAQTAGDSAAAPAKMASAPWNKKG